MDRDVTLALYALLQLLKIRKQKLDDEMKILLVLCELEESNLRYLETAITFLVSQESSKHKESSVNSKGVDINISEKESLISRINEKETKKNVYLPKYEWTDDRTRRLLESIKRHYSTLIKNKDFTKPVWQLIKNEVDDENAHLKWYTCRHKWTHMESDYNNYIKDLEEYGDRHTSPELMVYIPHYFEEIGNILRNVENRSVEHQSSSSVLQKVIEDRLGEVLKSSTWKEELRMKDVVENVITITDADMSPSIWAENLPTSPS